MVSNLFKVKEPQLGTQTGDILYYLRKGNRITGKKAYEMVGTLHLPRRILDLKEMGHRIDDCWITVPNGKKVKEWFLVPEGKSQ